MKSLPRWLRQAAKRKGDKVAMDGMNRAAFRAAGLQGRRDSQMVARKKPILSGLHEPVQPQWMGRRRRGFLTAGAQPAILVPHASTRQYREKLIRKMMARVHVKTVTEEESPDGM